MTRTRKTPPKTTIKRQPKQPAATPPPAAAAPAAAPSATMTRVELDPEQPAHAVLLISKMLPHINLKQSPLGGMATAADYKALDTAVTTLMAQLHPRKD